MATTVQKATLLWSPPIASHSHSSHSFATLTCPAFDAAQTSQQAAWEQGPALLMHMLVCPASRLGVTTCPSPFFSNTARSWLQRAHEHVTVRELVTGGHVNDYWE